eukprot:1157393-Pelagomonas_calceolata.AAC.6
MVTHFSRFQARLPPILATTDRALAVKYASRKFSKGCPLHFLSHPFPYGSPLQMMHSLLDRFHEQLPKASIADVASLVWAIPLVSKHYTTDESFMSLGVAVNFMFVRGFYGSFLRRRVLGGRSGWVSGRSNPLARLTPRPGHEH